MKTVNLYTGNIEGLILALQSMPIDAKTLQHYLNFANETTQKAAHEKFYIGCPKLLAQYQKSTLNYKPFANVGASCQFENEGLFFDIPTFLSGQPEHWINEVEDFTQTTAKDMVICLNAFWWLPTSDIFAKLVKIVDFIDNMEANGQRLNISLSTSFNPRFENKKDDKETRCNMLVNIKAANEPINLQQLLYLVASPVLMRYATLSLIYSNGFIYNSVGCEEYESEMLQNKEIVFIPSFYYDVFMAKNIHYKCTKTHKNDRVYYEEMKPINEFYPHLSN